MTGFERYVEQYSRDLARFCYRLCGNSHDADDLFQDTWTRAMEKYERFKPGTDFRKWLFAICVNIFKDSGRSKYNTAKLDFHSSADKERFLSSIHDYEKDTDAYIDLHGAILALPKKYRAVITLFYFREFSLKEIAQILDIPVGTVNSRLNTARKMLKRRLSHE